MRERPNRARRGPPETLIIRDRLSQISSEWITLSSIEKNKRSSLELDSKSRVALDLWIPYLSCAH